jgi:hypothetical protein
MPRTRITSVAFAAMLISSLVVASVQPGDAAAAVDHAKFADRAKTAQKVRGIGVSRRPRPGMLLPLGRNGRFPASVLTNIVDSSLVQRPLSRACPAGQSIRAISRMGRVTCQVTGSIAPPLVFNFQASVPLLDITNGGTGGAIAGKTTPSSTGNAVSAYNYGNDGYALWAELANANNPNSAIFARTAGGGRAIDAEVNSTTSSADAVFARTQSTNPGSYAGYFSGNVKVTGNLAVGGTLSKAGGAFRIDHPLSPATRYLQHSFVESPDMKNIYDGVIRTNGRGYATVRLPRWFQALNEEFRYQLTTIRSFAKAIVWREVSGNSFVIRTRRPRVKVSWQVTGIRHDPYARAHRIKVDVAKSGR